MQITGLLLLPKRPLPPPLAVPLLDGQLLTREPLPKGLSLLDGQPLLEGLPLEGPLLPEGLLLLDGRPLIERPLLELERLLLTSPLWGTAGAVG
jgi:hypothetical protein